MKPTQTTERTTMDSKQKPNKSASKHATSDDANTLSKIRIGLETGTRAKVVAELNLSIANASVLNVKTKKVHWDVVGPQFRSLHQLLDENYEMLSAMVDAIAERARMLGGHTIGTMVDFVEHSELTESRQVYNRSTEAVHVLVADHETVVRQVRKSVDACDELGDAGTADMLTGMLRQHEQILWMLRSFVEGESVMPAGDPKLLLSAKNKN